MTRDTAGQLEGRTAVVAGNGASITELEPGRILADDFIIRVNNFFFEPAFYLGQRVDLAFMAGDPRVAPFMFETLYRCRQDYQIAGWSSHNPRVVRAGQRRFGALYQPMQYRDDSLRSEVQRLIVKYQRQPTSGIYAVLMAHALGAEKIILAGLDFYTGAKRYPFEPGPHYRALMGQDLGQRGLDHHLHDLALDLDILKILQARGQCQLLRARENPVLEDLTSLAPLRAPLREGEALQRPRRNPPVDWASRSGIYPISLLKFLRRGSSLMRQIKRF
ncbi:hypothetical protein RSK20926_01142 [Roseobacter sp. SK209-2-6]|uniref:hypothetical protein n=1 Tax=Roseobacter sp. SK209-2-6 TaxID=388739 RepID=UPI0000F3F479|nr:hypothetical protein [Roseobacter sp. SK209-2-6]EBA14557.1 hypothetical protein RSK20926_01142 [Roseobacter sp. SK209-2-6]